MITKDVIIVGGGPAGAACAWKLGQAGVDYLLLDKAEFPRLKTCAGWVTPRVFKKLEITPEEYPRSLAHFSFFQIKIKNLPLGVKTDQYAIRRVEFDAWMLSRAEVNLHQHTVKSIVQENGKYIIDGMYTCNYMVGAGGTSCPVKKSLFTGISNRAAGTLIVAMEEEFASNYSDGRCHLWFLQNGLPGYAWYVPKPDGILNVGIGGSAHELKSKGDTLLQHWHLLIEYMEKCGLVRDHKYNPHGYSYHLRAKNPLIRNGNAFLTGDALGLATLDMGEGIGPAIESGIGVADAISTGREYSVSDINRYSFPSFLGFNK